jgi:hypothetical protein
MFPIWVLIIPDSSTRILCSVAAETPSSETEKLGEKWPLNFTYQYLSYLKGYLTYHKILQHGADCFTSPPKEVVLRIYIALKYPSLSAWKEPGNLGSNCKHDDHYTTDNDLEYTYIVSLALAPSSNLHNNVSPASTSLPLVLQLSAPSMAALWVMP